METMFPQLIIVHHLPKFAKSRLLISPKLMCNNSYKPPENLDYSLRVLLSLQANTHFYMDRGEIMNGASDLLDTFYPTIKKALSLGKVFIYHEL